MWFCVMVTQIHNIRREYATPPVPQKGGKWVCSLLQTQNSTKNPTIISNLQPRTNKKTSRPNSDPNPHPVPNPKPLINKSLNQTEKNILSIIMIKNIWYICYEWECMLKMLVLESSVCYVRVCTIIQLVRHNGQDISERDQQSSKMAHLWNTLL